jgi:hypothetical protein
MSNWNDVFDDDTPIIQLPNIIGNTIDGPLNGPLNGPLKIINDDLNNDLNEDPEEEVDIVLLLKRTSKNTSKSSGSGSSSGNSIGLSMSLNAGDIHRTCKSCKGIFSLNNEQLNYYKEKNYKTPKNCPGCRKKNREISRTVSRPRSHCKI